MNMSSNGRLPVLCMVAPCFNEQEVLKETSKQFIEFLDRLEAGGLIAPSSHALLVDDGSSDNTWSLIEQLALQSSRIRGLKLSRNRGHQNAVLAGLLEGDGDLLVSIDADLQDDVNAIEKMVRLHADEGAEIVYGVRANRGVDSFLKRVTAEGYYNLLSHLGVEIVFNHADFRLLSRRAIEELRNYEEVNLFLRGIVPLIGFKSGVVEYTRAERAAGESKYPLRKMLSLAWEGVTSLSVKPLRFISGFGFVVSIVAFALGTLAIIAQISGVSIQGWASLIVAVFFLGGVQLLAIGLIGEYVGKIYLEVKRRPRYVIEEHIQKTHH